MRKLVLLITLLFSTLAIAQEVVRTPLRGTVLYRSSNVVNENVINATSEEATITDENGDFLIPVAVGDRLVFTAVNYQLKVVVVTEKIIRNNRLVVEVVEKIQQLEEVVVSPDNQEKFLEMQNEDFKGYEYAIDRSTKVQNIALDRSVNGMQDGLNFANIFKALFKSRKKKGEEAPDIKVSEVLRQVYEDRFFVVDLKLPPERIDDFLLYCDDKIPSNALLRKENEFELIDFLVTHSKTYLENLNEENK